MTDSAWHYDPPQPSERPILVAVQCNDGSPIVLLVDALEWPHLRPIYEVRPYAWLDVPEPPPLP